MTYSGTPIVLAQVHTCDISGVTYKDAHIYGSIGEIGDWWREQKGGEHCQRVEDREGEIIKRCPY